MNISAVNTTAACLLIFVKNPALGKVKTRLAAEIGQEKALVVYRQLLEKTRLATKDLRCAKTVYYDRQIEENDIWHSDIYDKKKQKGHDLGERMLNAFAGAFSDNFTKACIIGSDCFDLTTEIINQAFEKLDTHDVVIGPALDGGYYLLGMKKLIPGIFTGKPWSQNSLLEETLVEARQLNLNCFLLPSLNDIDTYKDLRESGMNF